jgi:hypothetical protein
MVKDFDQPPLKALIQNNFSVIAIDIRGDKEVAINAEYTLSEKEFSSEIGVRYTPTVTSSSSSKKLFLNQGNIAYAVPPVTTPVFACTIPTNNINKILKIMRTVNHFTSF